MPNGEDLKIQSINPLYFYCPWRTTIFKASVCFSSNFKVEAKVPESIMYEEWRERERENIMAGDSLMVYFRKSNKAYSGQQNLKKSFRLF